MKHKKALSISTTGWKEKDYTAPGFQEAMHKLIDVYGFKFPGIHDVQHVYFYAVFAVDDAARKQYLENAFQLGKEF
jgi:NAD(P)H dehydrogenase (quinone)